VETLTLIAGNFQSNVQANITNPVAFTTPNSAVTLGILPGKDYSISAGT